MHVRVLFQNQSLQSLWAIPYLTLEVVLLGSEQTVSSEYVFYELQWNAQIGTSQTSIQISL